MAPPESEILLWAKRIVDTLRAEFSEKVQALSTSDAFTVEQKAQLALLDEQLRDVAACRENTQQTVRSLQHQIQEMETQVGYRDEEFKRQAEKQEEIAKDLTRQLKHVEGAMEQLSRDFQAASGERERVVRQLKARIGAFEGATGKAQPASSPAKPSSEATIVDESPTLELESPKKPDHSQQINLSITQGRTTYEEYVNVGENLVRAATRQSEIKAVKAVVSGMRQAMRRKPIQKTLEDEGWTWEVAKRELLKIVDEGKRKRKNKRTIVLPSLKEIDMGN